MRKLNLEICFVWPRLTRAEKWFLRPLSDRFADHRSRPDTPDLSVKLALSHFFPDLTWYKNKEFGLSGAFNKHFFKGPYAIVQNVVKIYLALQTGKAGARRISVQ